MDLRRALTQSLDDYPGVGSRHGSESDTEKAMP